MYPEKVYSDLSSWAIARNETYWLSCVAPKRGPKLQGWATPEQMIANMDEAGIEKAVILGWYWENSATCIENISWQLEWIRDYSKRFIAFAPFNAKGGQTAFDSVKRALDFGFKGIGELNPPAQGYDYENEWLDRILSMISEYNAIVNFHATDPSTHDYPGKIETPIQSLKAMADRHPKTKFIFAHLGGMMELPELKRLPNVYLDTAATPLLYDSDIYSKAIEQIGANRILFGTDYPLRTLPKKQKLPDFTSHLAQLENAGLAEKEVEKIVSLNAYSLLA